MSEMREIKHVTAARERADGLYLVWISYFGDDAANAVGQVVHTGSARGSAFRSVLNTNDFLSPFWLSPQQNLWIGSANGSVWTTAAVTWPPSRFEGLTYDVLDPALFWSVTTLPDMRRLGCTPNVTALWGSEDRDVHAGTYRGVMYHWDGGAWSEVFDARDNAVNRMHGLSPDDVYAVGYEGLILRWDGRLWQRIAYPGGEGEGEVLTGVRAVSNDEVYICSRSGRILRGGRDGFELFCELPLTLYGIALFQDRIFLAAGDSGVHELIGDKTQMIKDTFGAVDVYETAARLYFVEPTQALPSLIEHDPADAVPWFRRAFG